MKITAVVPVYNEEEVIDEFTTRLVESLENTTAKNYEVIFIVEGNDATMDKLKEISNDNPRVKLDYHEKRLGLGRAMKRGLSLIPEDTDYVVTMDADLNHQPEEIGRLLKATEIAEVVVGSRTKSRGMVEELPFFKRVVSGATNWLIRKIFRMPSTDVTSGFRIYSARAVESLRDELTSTNFEVTAELLIRAHKKGLTIAEVPITFTPRPRGTSKLSLVKSGVGYARLLMKLGL